MARIRVMGDDGRGRIPRKAVAALVLVGFVLVALFSSWFQVESNAVGVVTRFGRLVRVVQPGLQWKLPLGLERVAIVEIKRVQKMEFGFRSLTSQGGGRTRYDPRDYFDESLMLTGDLNAANVEWIIQYQIADPVKYSFNVQDPENTLRDLSRAVMSAVVGDRSVREVLTEGRREVNSDAHTQLQKLVDEYEMGLKIETVQLQNVDPPVSVRASFNDVNQAEQERERTVNEAWQEYNRAIPVAQGDALKLRQQAEGYAIDRVNRATGETQRFVALLEEYKRSPDVMRRRMWLETLGDVLPKLGPKIVVDENLKSVLPLLELGGPARRGPTGDRP